MNSRGNSVPEDTSPAPRQSTIITPQTTSTGHEASETDIYEELRTYPFVGDREFATGLAVILGHPETPASEEEISRDDDLVLQAKCYYFTRKANLASLLSVANYKTWLESRAASNRLDDQTSVTGLPKNDSLATDSSSPSANPGQQSAQSSSSQEPAYPTSFAHIVELITTGQPIPGIQQIPDTLLTGQGAASERPKRRKPWEQENSAEIS
ncbi:hypothetical protein BJY01DRAFT_230384 [Aspergillus pseudoustus]|uniref:Uncharacterized protein n=1 Tax=Aspergillus pseudoustus TaxID=1810923 RepID=A0ABR4ID14_9EURO